MKLYTSIGPNPRLVNMFLAEKGITIDDQVTVDLMGGENRRAPYTEKNPGGQLPALELDDGSVLAETVAICEYLEEKNPTPALIGSTPEERAKRRMWTRRVEQKIITPMADGFRFSEGLALFQTRLHVIPAAADDLKQIAQEGCAWLDALLESDYITGDSVALPDIALYAFLDFGNTVGQPLDTGNKKLAAWFERMGKRPSAAASA